MRRNQTTDSKHLRNLNMQQQRNQKDIRCFVGMVNFYRDLYLQRAETLAPLTELCGKNKSLFGCQFKMKQ
jgi:hypothetical protein